MIDPAFPVLFLGGSPGTGEIVVVFLVILVLFGPRRLPEIARQIGRVFNDLRRASLDFRNQIMSIDEVSAEGSAEGDGDLGVEECPFDEASEGLDDKTIRPDSAPRAADDGEPDDSELAG